MFGRVLRAHRQRLALTQEQLAGLAGLSERAIRNLESGRARPQTATVRLLADALDLSGSHRAEFFHLAAQADPTTEPAGAPAGHPDLPPSRRPATGRSVPAQLPLDVPGFAGRQSAIEYLDGLLERADEQPTAVVIAVLSGTAGVGKTALAVHWAHRVAHRFPDGQLYLNLRGFDPGTTPVTHGEALRALLDAFDVPPERIPAGADAQAALYRSLINGRRVLLVLDNARDTDQVRPLLPGAAGCLVLVTSRDPLSGLVATAAAHPLTVDLLTTAEARLLLSRRLGAERVNAAPQAVDEIIAGCARLPLALVIVAARAAIDPALSLTVPAAELRSTGTRLDALDGGDPVADVRAAFACSYHTLAAPARRLFRLLGLHPGADFAVVAAASLAGIGAAAVRPLLLELSRVQLINQYAPGRYSFHDLLRAYATDLAHAEDSTEVRRAALRRTLDHYLYTAHAAMLTLRPHRAPLDLPAIAAGVHPEELVDHAHALTWFDIERAGLVGAVQRAAAAGFDEHAWKLASTLTHVLEYRGHWQDWTTTHCTGLEVARRLGDRTGQGLMHRGLARLAALTGRHDEAQTHLLTALSVLQEAGDHGNVAHAQFDLGWVYYLQDRHEPALRHTRRALELFRATGNASGQATALNAIGWLYAQHGEYETALDCCTEALAQLQEINDRDGEAAVWDSLGYVHHAIGQYEQADTCYQTALRLYRELGDHYVQTIVLRHIGDNHQARGDTDAARYVWTLALAILDEMGHGDADELRTRLG